MARRGALFISVIVAMSFATLVPLATAGATGDTWTGTWSRNEIPGGKMFLTEKGTVVSGNYNWNDSSGHLGGTTSGTTLSGSFNETHYKGSFELKLAGTTYAGSYAGINKDTNGDISGSFSGHCLAGACLANGTTSSVSESDLAAAIIGEGNIKKYIDSQGGIANSDAASTDAQEIEKSFQNVNGIDFAVATNGEPAGVEGFVGAIGSLSYLTTKDGTTLFPTVHALLPVMLKMAAHAQTLGESSNPSDKALAQSYATAASRLLTLAITSDLPKS